MTPQPEGSFNFRDLGDGTGTVDGRKVRRGLVFRSGALDAVTDAGWATFDRLGVRTVFDLRADHEWDGDAPAAQRAGIDVVRIPMWADGEPGTTLSDRVLSAGGTTPEQFVAAYAEAKVTSYVAMVSAYAPGFGAVIDGLSRPGALPAVMHCSAGKDRTGVAAAILLGLLGVPEDALVADYLRSRNSISAERLARYQGQLERVGVPVEHFAPVYAAHPPALVAALAAMVARWGSIQGYLTGPGGMTPSVTAALRALLLAPASPIQP